MTVANRLRDLFWLTHTLNLIMAFGSDSHTTFNSLRAPAHGNFLAPMTLHMEHWNHLQ